MAADDRYKAVGRDAQYLGPLRRFASITPHDTNELAFLTRAIFIETTGPVVFVDEHGTAITIPGLTGGVWHPIRAKIIKDTGTTATTVLIAD